ncbi:hypothetical protein M422DRAFT_35637 [Sphaerobolus stellatus SS14]|uniref:F-box domain-containing protein n=1 Tax=Sphaerobolus stellatus (strain SS14) TaxID=990650 RepID=A0A0C9UE43_SPHS4|nr:hypothetical protein M422DRAFT_35637 [Sphaerobolus stellatus SS14]
MSMIPPDEIIERCSYTYGARIFDDAFISIKPSENTDERKPLPTRSRSSCGRFDRLPTEIIQKIFSSLPLAQMTECRTLSSHLKTIIASEPVYFRLQTKTYSGFRRIMYLTGFSAYFTATQIYEVFCTPICSRCTSFGFFLYLPECVRCCWSCIKDNQDLLPVTQSEAMAGFGITLGELKSSTIPTIRTLPGKYGLLEQEYRQTYHLMSPRLVRTSINRPLTPAQQRKKELHDAKDPYARHKDEVYQYLCTVYLPYFDPKTQETYEGIGCRGCRKEVSVALRQAATSNQIFKFSLSILFRRQYTMFTHVTFIEHFERCEAAQQLYHSSKSTPQCQDYY